MITAESQTKRKAKFFFSEPGFCRGLKCLRIGLIYYVLLFSILLFLLLASLPFLKTPAVYKGGQPGDLSSPLQSRRLYQETAQLPSKQKLPAEEQARLLLEKIDQPLSLAEVSAAEQARLLLEKIDQPLSLAEVSAVERDLVIYLYETSQPEQVQDLCAFLSSVSSSEDVKNIKYTVYTAPAAWRAAFLEASAKLHLCCRPGRDCYIAGLSKTVCVDMGAASADPRGPYTSFFHECAHGVCDVLYSGELKEAELSAQLAAETSLLSADRMYCEPWEEAVSDMRSAFAAANDCGLSFSSETARTQSSEAVQGRIPRLNAVVRCLHKQACVPSSSSQAQKTGYVHEASYWKTPDMPAKEFFAEYFSYRICRNGKALDCLENDCCGVYPRSSGIVRDMVYNTAL